MLTAHTRPTPWGRHAVAGAGALLTLLTMGAAIATHEPREAPTPVVEPPLDFPIAITMEPVPPAPKPGGRGGGGGGAAGPPKTAPVRTAAAPPSPEASQQSSLAPNLDNIDWSRFGRRAQDGVPSGGLGPVGQGTGLLGDDGVGSGHSGRVNMQLTPRETPAPDFPRAARELGLEALCLVTFDVDPRGRPTGVGVQGCASVFHEPIRKAAMRWRFDPAVVDGEPVPAQMTQRIRFILR